MREKTISKKIRDFFLFIFANDLMIDLAVDFLFAFIHARGLRGKKRKHKKEFKAAKTPDKIRYFLKNVYYDWPNRLNSCIKK